MYCGSKIYKLILILFVDLVPDNILRFYISVNILIFMHMINSRTDLFKTINNLIWFIDCRLPNPYTLLKFIKYEVSTVLIKENFSNFYDMWMSHFHKNFCLTNDHFSILLYRYSLQNVNDFSCDFFNQCNTSTFISWFENCLFPFKIVNDIAI